MVARLRAIPERRVRTVILDLSAIGRNLTLEQWFAGLRDRVGVQLDREDEMVAFWETHRHLGPMQRWLESDPACRSGAVQRSLCDLCGRDSILCAACRSIRMSSSAAIRSCLNRARNPNLPLLALTFLSARGRFARGTDFRMTASRPSMLVGASN